jgi:hypothetical protein
VNQQRGVETGTQLVLASCDALLWTPAMPRRARATPGGLVYHVLHRAVAGLPLIRKGADFEAFERIYDRGVALGQSVGAASRQRSVESDLEQMVLGTAIELGTRARQCAARE